MANITETRVSGELKSFFLGKAYCSACKKLTDYDEEENCKQCGAVIPKDEIEQRKALAEISKELGLFSVEHIKTQKTEYYKEIERKKELRNYKAMIASMKDHEGFKALSQEIIEDTIENAKRLSEDGVKDLKLDVKNQEAVVNIEKLLRIYQTSAVDLDEDIKKLYLKINKLAQLSLFDKPMFEISKEIEKVAA